MYSYVNLNANGGKRLREALDKKMIAFDEEACGELTVDTYKYFLDIEKKERL